MLNIYAVTSRRFAACMHAGGIGGTGPARWAYFRKVVAVPSLSKTGAALSFSNFNSGSLWIALVTFLYVDFFDATGTLFAMANFVNNFIPGLFTATGCYRADAPAMQTSNVAIIALLCRFCQNGRFGCANLRSCLGPDMHQASVISWQQFCSSIGRFRGF